MLDYRRLRDTTTARVARFIVRIELLMLIMIAPALLFPEPARLAVLTIVPILWGSARYVTGRFVPDTRLNVPLYVLLAMTAVSLIVTPDWRFSLGKVAGVLLGVLIYWGAVRWIADAARLRLALWAVVLAGGGLAVIGLLGFDNAALGFNTPNEPGKIPILAAITSRLPAVIRGVPGAEQGFSPNAIAGSLLLFLPLQFALIATPARRWLAPQGASRGVEAIILIANVVLLALTLTTWVLMQSRGGAAALVGAIGLFLLWSGRKGRITIAAAAVAGLVFWFSVGQWMLANTDWRRLLDDRRAIWSQAVTIIGNHPLEGVGMNMARRLIDPPRPASATGGDVAHAHNHLLQTALDLGLPGLAAYLAIWVLALQGLARVFRMADSRATRGVAGGLMAGLVAYFGFGMTDAIALGAKVGILFWVVLAVSESLTLLKTRQNPPK